MLTASATAKTAAAKTSAKFRTPKQHRVVMVNDDYTPMEFVIDVLQSVFRLDYTKATSIMLAVHHKGKATCGEYARDIAETKVAKVLQLAAAAGHPLYCYTEPV